MPLKYEEIAASLRSRIDAGEFLPGSLLPSGRELCELWGVSRATVVKAMDVLRADALVTSRQGAGFTVTTTPLARPAGDRRAADRSVGLPFMRLGRPSFEAPPRQVAEALGLSDGQDALRRARLMHLVDGTPHSLATAWFLRETVEVCPRLVGLAPIAEGTSRYVERCTGLVADHAVDLEEVRQAVVGEAELLGLSMPLAVHVVLHAAKDRTGRVLVVEEGVTPEGMWQRVAKYPMGSGN